jgi:hypothetical protein
MNPTIAEAFRRAIVKGRNLSKDGQALTMERVTAVLGNGQVEVSVRNWGPARIPVAGEGARTIHPGQMVAVGWENRRPVVAIRHTARRSGAPTPLPTGLAIVEVLFIAGAPGARDIFFRNDSLVTKLEIRAQLAGDPEEVKWGARGDDFFVRVGLRYYTFLLDRNDADDPVTSDPEATLLRPPEVPWDGETLLSTMTHSVTFQLDTPCTFKTVVQTIDFAPFAPDSHVETAGLASTLSRSASYSAAAAVKLTQDTVDFGIIAVLGAELDWEHNLILRLRVRLSTPGSPFPRPTGSVAGIATKHYEQHENPPGTIVSSSGDPAAQSGQPTLGGTPIPLGSSAADADDYGVLINLTQRSIVWSSLLPAPTLTEDVLHTSAPASARLIDHTELNAPPFGANTRDLAADHLDNLVPFPNLTTPPAGAALLPVSYASRLVTSLQAIDLSRLGFLGLSAGDLEATLIPATFTRYSIVFGSNGSNPDPDSLEGFTGAAIEATFTDESSYRPTMLFLSALLYLPHRTKAGGDLLLFARKSLSNGISGTGAQYSFWRVDVESGVAKVIAPWTPFTGEATPTVLGASLQHVLWTLRVRNPANIIEQVTTVYLSDTERGTSKALLTGTATSGVPAEVAAFLERDWQVLRPDLLYVLDGTDPDLANQFVDAWTDEAVTLDPAHPETASEFADLGELADLPEDVIPLAPAAARSVRVLVRPEVDDPEDL